ncbi:o-succinylbenzoate synthase [Carnobacterium gallinarum]|uniref:o-succinylbenzoate synthase n=1 Tax=Carnobacterium gallinarum TaxID=2749 RepID=UPI0005535CE3|nr:o-succinylbenzoate synthase [Carnobacterium gallinarum]
MRLTKVTLYQLEMPLVTPFRTSYGVMENKNFTLIEVEDSLGYKGYGELEAFTVPDYTEETEETARIILLRHLLPLLKGQEIQHPCEIRSLFAGIRGNEMAKSAIETAIWDLYGRQEGKSIQNLIGGVGEQVPVGVSIGIQPDLEQLIQVVAAYVAEGYTRVKLKIQPGFDVEPIAAVRKHFPDLRLMADANSAYTRLDLAVLKALDLYNLEMLEQPFGVRDFVDHAWLQRQMVTRICLDENIRCLGDVQLAKELGSCRGINLKLSRVGGIQEAIDIAEYCQQNDLLVWCGGMLEAGVGRAFNIALASRAEFKFPGDISASNRYFKEDIIQPEFQLTAGTMTVPTADGIGVAINWSVVERYCLEKTTYELRSQ